MSQILSTVAVIGIDIGENLFHVVGLDGDGAIVLRQKWSRGQVEARLANAPLCLIGMGLVFQIVGGAARIDPLAVVVSYGRRLLLFDFLHERRVRLATG